MQVIARLVELVSRQNKAVLITQLPRLSELKAGKAMISLDVQLYKIEISSIAWGAVMHRGRSSPYLMRELMVLEKHRRVLRSEKNQPHFSHLLILFQVTLDCLRRNSRGLRQRIAKGSCRDCWEGNGLQRMARGELQ
jgi:hypothetical protein